MVWYGDNLIAGTLALAIGLCLLLTASSAVADEGDDPTGLRSQLEQLESGVSEGAGREEFDRAQQWLLEAEEIRLQGARRGLEQRKRRVDHMITLIAVMIETNDMRVGMARQIEALERSRQQIEELRADIESLQAQKADRQRELDRIQGSD